MSGLARFTTEPGPPLESPRTVEPEQLPRPLRRFLERRPGPAPGEACEMCSAPIHADHRHVVDLDSRRMQCVCRGCGLLFLEEGAARGRYRTVPERYLKVEPFTLTDMQWAALQIPVGIVFVVRNTQLGTDVAFYPGPGGATESELPLASWDDIVAANPPLGDVEADTEAALIRNHAPRPGGRGRAGATTECFVVPVDRCYELVGRLRMGWTGFDGGQEARDAIETFFADISGRAKVVS